MLPIPPPFPYPILYRSPRFVVIDKPSGLPVHPGPRTTDTLEDALPALTKRPDGPWLVHRLDADTSGCILIALRKQALINAQKQFTCRNVHKTYWAVTAGQPPGDEGDMTLPLLRQDGPKGWRITPDMTGQPAHTHWRVLATNAGASLLELTLHTGRTHQARVHCAALGCPILGDTRYNPHTNAGTPLHLLARHLRLTVEDEMIEATAAPHPAMAQILRDFVAF